MAALSLLWYVLQCGSRSHRFDAVVALIVTPLCAQVMFVCLLQNIVARSPLIFITLAEVPSQHLPAVQPHHRTLRAFAHRLNKTTTPPPQPPFPASAM